jgi:hypothetical protein
MRRRQPSFREDHTNSDTLTVPVRNYVSANLGNYVSDKPLNLGKSVSADKRQLVPAYALRPRSYGTVPSLPL